MHLITSVRLITRFSVYPYIIPLYASNVSMNIKETSLHMVTQEAEYNLESDVCGQHVYKYIWTPCLGAGLSLCTDMGNAHDSYHTMLLL